jgi:hypothetical protein
MVVRRGGGAAEFAASMWCVTKDVFFTSQHTERLEAGSTVAIRLN